MPDSPDPDGAGAAQTLLPGPSLSTDDSGRAGQWEQALLLAPGGRPVILLRPVPVRVRSMAANAVAYTVTAILVEWDKDGEYCIRWEASWLVRRLNTDC